MASPKRISTYMVIIFGAFFLGLAAVVIVSVNYNMRAQALAEAESKSRLLLDRNLATHTYFTKDLKPSLFETIGSLKSKDYFDPNWMSSTYAVMKMEKYFHHFNQGPYYYKECSVDARSTENEADELEKQFLRDLGNDPQLIQRTEIRTIDGQPFLTVMRRGEAMEESCLRCHSTPDKAPGDLVKRYGPDRSFNRNVGDVVQAISMRIPLAKAYANAQRFTAQLSGILLGVMGVTFVLMSFLMRQFIVSPLSLVAEKASLIAASPSSLGEVIELPKSRELQDLVTAFNNMSARLKSSYDNLEIQVQERTSELQAANEALRNEVAARKEAEEELRTTLYSIGDAVLATDRSGRVNRMNVVAERLTGWMEEDARGRPLAEVFHIVNEDSGEVVENPVESVMRDGVVVGLGNHTLLIDRKGIARPIVDSASPIRDEHGQVLGVVLVFRDQTEERRVQERIRKSEELYRSLCENMNDAVAVYRAEGDGDDFIFVDFNKAGENIEGLRREDIIGNSVLRVFPKVKEFGLFDVFQRVWRTGEPERLPVAHYRDDRIAGWRDNFVYKLPSGELVAIYSDETERKQLEEELRKSEALFRTTFERSTVGMSMTAVDGRLLRVNNAFAEMLGYTLEEMHRLDFSSITHPDDVEASMEFIRSLLSGERQMNRLEKRYIHKDKEIVWAEISSTLFLDDEKHPLFFITSIVNITARKMAEKALRESEERYRAIFDNAAVGIDLVDQNGAIVSVNRTLSNLLGYSLEELRQLTLSGVTHPDDLKLSKENLDALMKGEIDSYRMEKRYLKKDGGMVWADLSVSAIRDASGRHVATVGVIADITDRKNLQAQLLQAQKMEAVGTLAGGIAHDFNNLLQVVCGYSEILLAGKTQDDPDRESLQKMLNAGQRGAELVRNLMTFSRRVEPMLRMVDVNHEVVEFQKLLSRTIPKMIRIDLRLSGDVAPVMADPAQIGQILMNLGVNARDAMPDGGTLTIQTAMVTLDDEYCAVHPEMKSGAYVQLAVSDTGIGMDKQTVTRIFDPFFSTKEIGKGTGLGLAIVYGIVKQHKGHVTCYSESGVGTTFEIYLPIAESETSEESLSQVAPIQGGTETILLVDDEEVVLTIGTAMLSQFGYTVIGTVNGKEALELYRQRRGVISLVILDWIMPEMDGKACLREILQISPDARVVIASGYADADTQAQARSLGARAFVEKPYETRTLLRTVREVLDSKG